MVYGKKSVIWTQFGLHTLDSAIEYVAKDSIMAAQNLLEITLEAASSL